MRLDFARLTVNPFGFKTDSNEAAHHRDRTAERLSRFFETVLDGPEAFYDLWNGFVGYEDDLFRIAIASQTWQRVADLRSSGLTTLFGIFFLEAVAGSRSVAFPDWLRAKHARGVNSFSLDEIAGEFEAYNTEAGALRTFRELLQSNLEQGEKTELLRGFQFTKPFRLGEDHGPWNHIYCKRDMCGSWCDRAPEDRVDELFWDLAGRLYEMRSAVVHRNGYVLFTSEENHMEGIVTVPEMYDTYLLRGQRLVNYSTHIEVGRLMQLFKMAALRYCQRRFGPTRVDTC